LNKSFLPLFYRSIIISLTVVAIAIIFFAWRDFKEDRIKDLSYTSSVLKRYYELSFKQWRNTLLNLGERLIQVNGDNRDSLRLEIVNKALKNYEELSAFGFADPNGQILTLSNRNIGDSLPNLMQSENSRRSFSRAKEASSLTIGEVYYFDEVSDWILPMRVPIRNNSTGQLLAVNTSALEYDQINKDLQSFGFNKQYRIHLSSDEFEVTQIYYPLAPDEYQNVLCKSAALYANQRSKKIGGLNYVEAYNNFEATDILLISLPLEGLKHTLNVSVDQKIIWEELLPTFFVILFFYFFLILGTTVLFRYSRKKQETFTKMVTESEANLKAIFESTNSLIALFDRDKRLLEFNQAFANYTVMTDNIVSKKGMDLFELVKNKETAKEFSGYQDRALAGQKFIETITVPTEEGNSYFLFSYNPIIQNDRITGLSLFMENITELKSYEEQLVIQAEELEQTVQKRTSELQVKNTELEAAILALQKAQQRLVQSEKMASLGILSAGIGHEINNPLNFIKNGASALLANLEAAKVDMKPLSPFFNIIKLFIGLFDFSRFLSMRLKYASFSRVD
jgi:PAS domain S-box-containing protein